MTGKKMTSSATGGKSSATADTKVSAAVAQADSKSTGTKSSTKPANTTTSSRNTEGGRFDFNDGGSYVGEWGDGRAHGLGIATGPEDNPGEYAGEWILGFESLGVYVWPSGSVYEGRWMKGKRHGEGIQVQGRWKYKGEFTTGFCGRYGVRESMTSCAKYEGSWNLNQFDGFGVETSSDGSVYAGGWTKGLRSGLGVRKSVTYSMAADYRPGSNVRATISQGSIPNLNADQDISMGPDYSQQHRSRLEGHKNGFVLVGNALSNNPHHSSSGAKSLSVSPSGVAGHSPKKGFFETGIFRKRLFTKLRKQKSTGDLANPSQRTGRGGGSLRSTVSTASQMTNHSIAGESPFNHHVEAGAEVLEANTTECYMGQWLEDKRTGYGVAERSDGLRYEGEWLNNKKNGYGCTYFSDQTKEEGRYRNNILVSALNRKNKLLLIRNSRMRDCVDAAVAKAQQMGKDAQTKAQESANQRAQTANMASQSAEKAAKDARKSCELARAIAYEFAPDFIQPGHIWERNKDADTGLINLNTSNTGANKPAGNTQVYHHMSNALRSNREHQMQQRSGYDDLDYPDGIGDSLEVSGGFRRGSFRSSFRRNKADAANAGDEIIKPISAQGQQNTAGLMMGNHIGQETSLTFPQQGFKTPSATAAMTIQQQAKTQKTGNQSGAVSHALPYNPTSLTQPAVNSSKSPVSAQQHSSATPQASAGKTATGTADSPSGLEAADATDQSSTLDELTASTVVIDHFDQYSTLNDSSISPRCPSNINNGSNLFWKKSQTSAQYSIDDPTYANPSSALSCYSYSQTPGASNLPQRAITQSPYNQESQKNSRMIQVWGGAKTNDSGISSESSITRGHIRRRTLPSIMTTKPVKPLVVTKNQSNTQGTAKNAYDINSLVDFNTSDASTFIIENGIRKKVQANSVINSMNRTAAAAIKNVNLEGDELAPLPRSYNISSQRKLCKDLGEGSLPDVSVYSQTSQEVMTREEVSLLSQAQRQKRLIERERRKRGEIVIRVADIKDWMLNNVWVIVLLMVNVVLASFLISLLKEPLKFPDDELS